MDIRTKHIKILVVVALFVVVGLPTIFSNIFSVQPDEIVVVKSWGGNIKHVYNDTGLRMKIPFLDSKLVLPKSAIGTSNETLSASTVDLLSVSSIISLNFKLDPREQSIKDFLRDIRTIGNLKAELAKIIQSESKVAIGKYKASEINPKREIIIANIKSNIQNRLNESWKDQVELNRVNLQNIKFPPDYIQSIAAKEKAKQDEQKELVNLNIKAIEFQRLEKEAESNAKAKKLQTDAENYRIREIAKAEADSITIKGKAEASAILAKNEALKASDDYVELVRAQQWNGSVPTTLTIFGEGANNVVPLYNVKDSINPIK